MPKKNRLSHADFNSPSLKRARRFHGTLFSISVSALPENSTSKVACIVSKKIARRAVDRKLIQRRCREVMRPLLKSYKSSRTLIFYAKKEAKSATFAQIEKDVKILFKQASL